MGKVNLTTNIGLVFCYVKLKKYKNKPYKVTRNANYIRTTIKLFVNNNIVK